MFNLFKTRTAHTTVLHQITIAFYINYCSQFQANAKIII